MNTLRARLTLLLAFLVATTLAAAPACSQSDRPAAPQQTPTALEQPEMVQKYQQTITPGDLASYLYTYSSDYFQGREATTEGQKLAVNYLAGLYRKLGLTPKGTAATEHRYAPEAYYQPFTVYGRRLTGAALTVRSKGQVAAESRYTLDAPGQSAFPVLSTMRPDVEGPVVFAGYGIAGDSTSTYSDYAALQEEGINPSGKWILALRDEPMADAATSLIQNGEPTDRRLPKIRAAFNAGARGILFVGDLGPGVEESIAARAAEQARSVRRGAGGLSLSPPDSAQRGGYPPVYVISSEMANALLAPTGRTVEALKAAIDENVAPTVFALEDVRVQSTAAMSTYKATTENVLAAVEGSDPQLNDEVVVITSHLDHLGRGAGEGDVTYNGADDDGTGTVAMLEIAEAFMKAKRAGHGPRRTVLFLHVTAEEKGLLGSQYYADREPVYPMEKTVADLNIDMIGRGDPSRAGNKEFVYVIGGDLISEDLGSTIAQVNEATGTDLALDDRYNSTDDPNRFYARSDHYNFGKHGVPFSFFFTGTHEDYHRPGDEAQKIRYDSLATITRLIFGTAWQLANQDTRPAVSNPGLFN